MWIILLTLFVRFAFCWRWNLLCSAVALLATQNMRPLLCGPCVMCRWEIVCRKCQFAGPMHSLLAGNGKFTLEMPLATKITSTRMTANSWRILLSVGTSAKLKKTNAVPFISAAFEFRPQLNLVRGTNCQAAQRPFKWEYAKKKTLPLINVIASYASFYCLWRVNGRPSVAHILCVRNSHEIQ